MEKEAGISVVSGLATKEAIELGKVSAIDIPILKITREFYIITKKTKELTDTAKAVISPVMAILQLG